MRAVHQFQFSPETAPSTMEGWVPVVRAKLGIPPGMPIMTRLIHRSVDARHGRVRINLAIEVSDEIDVDGQMTMPPMELFQNRMYAKLKQADPKKPVVIVGAGPAGLFAAFKLLERGFKPILLERGADVRQRKRDLAALLRTQVLNPHSNYGFGEGGAGAFSDGKLFTRSKKRGNNNEILELLVAHGANDNILYESHPHIGSDVLPGIIANIRKTIEAHGGEFHFNAQVADLITAGNTVLGVELKNGDKIEGAAVLLATGHSARDIYVMLEYRGVMLQAKGFAAGVRIEHPQALINRIQYHRYPRMDLLPAAEYSLVAQASGRAVYSFCMCPGGFIVPAATAKNEFVVNGMSPSRRNTPFANAGTVVEFKDTDFSGPMEAMDFQQQLEQLAYRNGGGGQQAPAQRMTDFVNRRASADLPVSSYIPGLVSSPLHEWLPIIIGKRLLEGIRTFDRMMPGYYTSEAVLVGVESRTSSPVRIPRDAETRQSVSFKRLYPCGEGAGYSGGIVSSALDGMLSAAAVPDD